MEIMEDETVTVTRKKHVKTLCDICGEDVNMNTFHYHGDITICHEYRSCYPDGCGYEEIFQPDICPKCFVEKILPFLKSLGINTNYKEDYF